MAGGVLAAYDGLGRMRRLGWVVAIGVAIVDILYVWYIRFGQGGAASDLPLRVPFVAAYLALSDGTTMPELAAMPHRG